jgi:hypothetical protein
MQIADLKRIARRSQAQMMMHMLRNAGIAALGLLFLCTQPSARADNIAYMITTNQFGTIDLSTGVFTDIGSLGQLLSGLGDVGGNLYGGVDVGDTLYEVNQATGALTAVGTGSITYAAFGSTLSGLYAFGVWDGSRDLYSINPATGAATLIGPTGVSKNAISVGMSSGSGALYFTNDSDLYSLNTTTGAATLIGNTGVSAFGALVSEGGVLYGGSYPDSDVYTLNTTTGAATLVTGTSVESGAFWGLAPDPLTTATPEPSSFLLLGSGLAGLAGMIRRKLRG